MFWLMKSEPTCYSIDDLERDDKTAWDGVRNYQARNFMRDEMQIGDLVFFYHSNADPTGIAGIGKVASSPYPDATAFDPKQDHYDPKSDPDHPRWMLVDIAFVKKFEHIIPLAHLRTMPALNQMALLQKGQRLSIQKVTESEWNTIMQLTETHAALHS